MKEIVSNEMERIKNDSKLKHLVKEDSSIQNLKESEHSAEGDRFRNIKRWVTTKLRLKMLVIHSKMDQHVIKIYSVDQVTQTCWDLKQRNHPISILNLGRPKPMMDNIEEQLRKLNVKEDAIIKEIF